MKKQRRSGRPGGVPDWAWYITWGIMIAGIIINIIGIVGRLIQLL